MKVRTFFLVVDFGENVKIEFRSLSRVALERYREWYREDHTVFGMSYGMERF